MSVSAPLDPSTRAVSHATPRTTTCITPRWYSTEKSAETKMIVGSTRNAKTKPAGPAGSTSAAPKTKRAPSAAQARIDSTQAAARSRATRPASTRRRNAPRSDWSARPPSTVRIETARRRSDIAHATPRMTTHPSKPCHRPRSFMTRSSNTSERNTSERSGARPRRTHRGEGGRQTLPERTGPFARLEAYATGARRLVPPHEPVTQRTRMSAAGPFARLEAYATGARRLVPPHEPMTAPGRS